MSARAVSSLFLRGPGASDVYWRAALVHVPARLPATDTTGTFSPGNP